MKLSNLDLPMKTNNKEPVKLNKNLKIDLLIYQKHVPLGVVVKAIYLKRKEKRKRIELNRDFYAQLWRIVQHRPAFLIQSSNNSISDHFDGLQSAAGCFNFVHLVIFVITTTENVDKKCQHKQTAKTFSIHWIKFCLHFSQLVEFSTLVQINKFWWETVAYVWYQSFLIIRFIEKLLAKSARLHSNLSKAKRHLFTESAVCKTS